MTFAELGLKPEILRAIAEVGYTEPTPIQEQAIQPILDGHDVIGAAQTGTGKTAAFVWPILQKLMEGERKGVRALILEPTRELAQQVEENMNDYGKYTGLLHTVLYGGVGLARQQTALKEGMDILVATPGRLLDHMDRGNLFFFDLRFLVLDEADRMTDMGFLPDLKRILKRLPAGRQTLLFSATIPPEIETLARATLWEPVEIVIGERAAPAEGVTHEVYPVRTEGKFEALRKILLTKTPDSTLIFTKTKKGANELGEGLREAGLPVGILHSDRTQQAREITLKRFREGEYKFLVATDIAARGLDIDGITHIVNYDVPLYPEDYVHRIGRTARAKAVGEAITLVTPEEVRRLKSIEKLVRLELPRFTLEGEPMAVSAVALHEGSERRPAVRGRGGRGGPPRARSAGSPARAPRREGASARAAEAPHREGTSARTAEAPREPRLEAVHASNGQGASAGEGPAGAPKKRRRGRRGGRKRRRPETAQPATGEAGRPAGSERTERRGPRPTAAEGREPRGPERAPRHEPRSQGGRPRERQPRTSETRSPAREPKTPAPARPAAEKPAAQKPAIRSLIGKIFSGWGGRGKN